LPVRSCVIDGEAIACDQSGLAVFELVLHQRRGVDLVLCAFDLLELDGKDMRHVLIEDRKLVLANLLRQPHKGIAFNLVGITAMPLPDGTQKAVEVHVFEESLRGTGEGHYPWDLMPNSTMTNGAVAQQVQKVEGNTLQVKYKDGEKTIVVPSDAEVVNLVAGGKADLKTGAHVFIPRWEKQGDGTWQATVVVVGRDGITPPM
jgi:uncharacterized protein YqkB